MVKLPKELLINFWLQNLSLSFIKKYDSYIISRVNFTAFAENKHHSQASGRWCLTWMNNLLPYFGLLALHPVVGDLDLGFRLSKGNFIFVFAWWNFSSCLLSFFGALRFCYKLQCSFLKFSQFFSELLRKRPPLFSIETMDYLIFIFFLSLKFCFFVEKRDIFPIRN